MQAPLPPGQQLAAVRKWPFVGERAPGPGPAAWTLTLVEADGRSYQWTWDELFVLPRTRLEVDIHCVTRWSILAMPFVGVTFADLLKSAGVVPSAAFVSFISRSERRHSTSLRLADALELNTLLAWEAQEKPLESVHGGPLRSVVPGRYFYKSVKWLERIELLDADRLGYWESTAGYHNGADPWLEQRYLAPTLDRREAARLLEARDFSGLDLRGIDARGHNLAGLQALNALLRDSDFRGCDLTGANFAGANLSNARLADANLRGASFLGADLEGADFSRAELNGANFTGASIFGASFAPVDQQGQVVPQDSARWDGTTQFDAARLEDLQPAQRSLFD
jgi:DMSO/TMAO reductase YedYZ molybdopterin-dependent catalytic subunit